MTLLQPALDVGSRRGGDAHPTGRRARATRTLYEDGGRSQRVLVRPFLFAARGDGRRGGAGPGGAPAAAQRRGRTTWTRDEAPADFVACREGDGPGGPRGGARGVGRGAALISLSPPQTGGPGGMGGASLRWRNSVDGPQRGARDLPAPAGAKGWLVDSMCQIASASRRARSTWAILGPRWRPSRVL